MSDPAAARLARATGSLATAATARMEERLPWFRQLSAQDRAWVGLVAQTGIATFVEWLGQPPPRPVVPVAVFDTAPRDLARAISLEQTVEMVRCTIDLIEEQLPDLAGPESADEVREAVLVYSREVAFAAAEVYARAAEARGAWDARLEALVIDSLVRGESDGSIAGRFSALGWSVGGGVCVLVGSPPSGDDGATLDVMRRAAAHHRLDLLTGLHGPTLVAVAGPLAESADSMRVGRLLTPYFGPGPVVIGPVARSLDGVAEASGEALAAYAAAPGWPDAPRPVHSDDLLPERALAGDMRAIERLRTEITDPLAAADSVLAPTLVQFLERTASLEGTARALYVHTNTVRHRLRRIERITGRSATDPRDALTLRVALILARLDVRAPMEAPPRSL